MQTEVWYKLTCRNT